MDNFAINPQTLASELTERAAKERGKRFLLGLVGIPGGGKSTLADRLLIAINSIKPGIVVVAPMDGFHYPNQLLDTMGLRSRKGASKTFDVTAYVKLLEAAKDVSQSPAFPIYDRELHEPRYTNQPQHIIGPEVEIVITEGNYLLLNDDGWADVRKHLDACWYLDTDLAQAREWVIGRHIKGGRSPEEADAQYERNDLPNAEQVIASSVRADRILHW